MAKTKTKKKSKGKTVLIVILCIILAIALAAVLFIHIVTRPSLDTEKHYAVGNMVYSDTVEYQAESGKGIQHHPVVKFMEMVWRFCADGDAAKHAVQTPPSDVTEINDLAYIDDGNIYHKMDVYYPEGTTPADALPMIIDIHGGGWIYGDKELNKYYCLELAHKGYVVFNISYRLVPDVTVNEQIQDCMAAMNYISEIHTQYSAGNTFLLTGDSAGGMLSAYTAAIMSSDELQEIFDAKYTAADFQPTALLLTSPVAFMKGGGMMRAYTEPLWGKDYEEKKTYGYMNLDEVLEKATLPPTYLITSDGDAMAHDATIRTYDLLQKKGIKSEMKNFGNDENGKALPHVFSVLNPFDKSGQEAIDGALAFYQGEIQ